MTLFQAGDRVRITDKFTGHDEKIIGCEGVLKTIRDSMPFDWDVELPERNWLVPVRECEIELVATNSMVKQDDMVTKPAHYQSGLGVEVIDIIREYFADNYNLGNVLKYLLRADKKGNRQQDLEKALQYLTWEVEHGKER